MKAKRWTLQPEVATQGDGSVICEGAEILAIIDAPIWDPNRRGKREVKLRKAAQLMVAAPMMLAALERIIDCPAFHADCLATEDYNAFWAAKDAIAKAKGDW